jgi:hypothetical protein
MTINVKSAFTSGLVAGIIIIIIGFGLVPVLGNQMNAVLESRSLPPLSNGAMGFFAFVSITFGISVIWFYAYFLPNAALVAYGFMPFSLSAIGTVWGILEVLIACIVGSRLYKEVN